MRTFYVFLPYKQFHFPLYTTISRILESNFTNFFPLFHKILQFYKMALFLTNFFCISFCSQSSYYPLHTPVFLSRLLFHLKITSIPLYFWDDSLYFSRNNGVKFYELSSILQINCLFSRFLSKLLFFPCLFQRHFQFCL